MKRWQPWFCNFMFYTMPSLTIWLFVRYVILIEHLCGKINIILSWYWLYCKCILTLVCQQGYLRQFEFPIQGLFLDTLVIGLPAWNPWSQAPVKSQCFLQNLAHASKRASFGRNASRPNANYAWMTQVSPTGYRAVLWDLIRGLWS